MRALKGKNSNLTITSKFFNSLPSLSQPYDANGSVFPFLMRLRLFSSRDGSNPSGGQFRRSGFDDFNNRFSEDDDDNDKFSGKNRRNLSAHQNDFPPNPIPGRPLGGERQSPQFQRQNAFQDRNFTRQGRDFNERFSGERSRTNVKSNDDLVGNDKGRGNVGLGGYDEGRKDSRPSIRELLNRPLKGEEGIGKQGSDFLEKFKLGVEDKKENQSDESKDALPLGEEKVEGKIEPSEDADKIFKKMKQSGLIPNAVAMLDGLCRDGLVQEAMKLFGVMREKGIMPEVVVYTAVVEGFCQAQKFDDAKRVFRKMQNNGIVPNAFSYTVLIKGLCKGKRLEEAVDFSVEMLEAGHSPNVTTFTGLVHEFCKEKGVEEAQNMIGSLKQKGFYLDEKAVRNYLDKTGPTAPTVWEAIFGPKKATQRAF